MMCKKKLLLVPLPPPFAGPETIARGIVDAYMEMGITDITSLNSSIRQTNREKGKFDLHGLYKFISVYFRFLIELMRLDSVFLYICSSRVGFLRDSVYILTAKLFGSRILAQYHGGNFDGFYGSQPAIYQSFIRLVLGRLSCLFVLGNSLKSMFHGLLPDDKISVLMNGIDPADFPMRTIQARSTLNILYLGHLTFPKGFYDLILAYRKLRGKYGDSVRLTFAGERVGYKPALSKFLNERWSEYYLSNINAITETIEYFIDNSDDFGAEYLGVVGPEERIRALHDADVFVLPSYTEGMSMSCIEAMSTGLPVITTSVGAMPEIVIDGEGGLITSVGSMDELARNIEYIMLDREKADSMGTYNRQYVIDNLTIRSVAERLLSFLRYE